MDDTTLLTSIYNVVSSQYVVMCAVVFVVLPLCALIWFFKNIWYPFL